jgi:WD40 repeat protein
MDIYESILTALIIGAFNQAADAPNPNISVAYYKLKDVFSTSYSRIDLAALEQQPYSQIRRKIVREELELLDFRTDPELLVATQELLSNYDQENLAPNDTVGVSIEKIQAASLTIRDVQSLHSGIRINDSQFTKDITIENVRPPSKKSDNEKSSIKPNTPPQVNFEHSSAGKIHLGDKYYFLLPGTSVHMGSSENDVRSSAQLVMPQDDWLKLFEADTFHDRIDELGIIIQWVTKDSSHVIGIFGMGGIGKTTLLAKIAAEVTSVFDHIIGLSMVNKPPINDILRDCIEILSKDPGVPFPSSLANQLHLLYHHLQNSKSLIMIDNIETILSEEKPGEFIAEYEAIGQIIGFMGEKNHNSCLLLSGREAPKDFNILVGESSFVRSFKLTGFNVLAAQEFVKHRGLLGSEDLWKALVEKYSGNPLILRIVSATIREIYNNDISEFLSSGAVSSDDTFKVIGVQFERLSEIEKAVMYMLAIEREQVGLAEIEENLVGCTMRQIITALESLQRRSLIDRFGKKFGLQNVVLEYVTERLIQAILEEIKTQKPNIFHSHPLLIASSKDYIRAIQTELIIDPLINRLERYLANREAVEEEIYRLLSVIRENRVLWTGYSTGNIVNLLIRLKGNLDRLDFSGLTVRQAFMRGVSVKDTHFKDASFSHAVFTENFSGILSVAYSEKSDLFAAGTFSGDIRIWKRPDYTYLKTLRGHTDWVWKVVLSPDGKYCISCSEDQTVRVWDIEGEQEIQIFKTRSWVRSMGVNFETNLVAYSNGDNTVEVKHFLEGSSYAVLEDGTGSVLQLDTSRDGKKLATGKEDCQATLWDLETKRVDQVFSGHQGRVRAVALSRDCKLLVTGSADQTVRVWDTGNGNCLNIFRGHKAWIRSVALDRTNEIVASCSNDGEIRLWSLNTNECLRVLRGQHIGPVWSVTFHPTEKILVSGGGDQKIQFWNIDTGEPIIMLKGYTDVIWALAFKPDSNLLISGGDRKVVQVWNVKDNRCISQLHGHHDTIWALNFSRDGAYFASASGDHTIKVWHTETLHLLRTLTHEGLAWDVKFSPDQQLLASCSERQVKVWKVSTGECIKTFSGHTDEVWAVAFSPNGKYLASASDDQTIRLWDIEKDQVNPIRVYIGHTGWVRSLVFSKDGRFIITGSGDQTCKVWDVETGQVLRTLTGHSSWIRSVAIHSNDHIIATGGGDHTIRIWDFKTGECISTLHGHNHLVRKLAFNSSGDELASASEDGEIRIWNTDNWECTHTLTEGRPYEGMDISQASGLSSVQADMLKSLGAIARDN